MSPIVKELKFKTAEEFIQALLPFSSDLDVKASIFRGHSNVAYQLLPTALRKNTSIWEFTPVRYDNNGPIPDSEAILSYAEFQVLRDFYQAADRRGLNVPVSERLRAQLHVDIDYYSNMDGGDWLPDDLLETAGLAQHYGVPTRLLDWSYDPMVAAFFASRPQSLKGSDICVWAVNPSIWFDSPTHQNVQTPLKIVTPPYFGNPNLNAQQGLFTYWAKDIGPVLDVASDHIKGKFIPVDRRPFDALVCDEVGHQAALFAGMFTKLILANDQAWRLANCLRSMGYGPARLFPGYGGVVQELQDRKTLRDDR